ncbi:MAG: hypothetical protein AAGJ46_15695 [Planctomycetota bacterium]
MWLLRYLNPETGPPLAAVIGVFALLAHAGGRRFCSGRTTWRLRRWATILGGAALTILVLTTALYVPFAMASCLVFDSWLGEWHDEIDVSGVVVAGGSREPAPDSRVVVGASAGVFMRNTRYAYAACTNERGEFQVRVRLPEPCNRIQVFAATPNDHFASVAWQKERVVLATARLTGEQADRHYLRYQHFTGGAAREIEFQCEPWLAEARD